MILIKLPTKRINISRNEAHNLKWEGEIQGNNDFNYRTAGLFEKEKLSLFVRMKHIIRIVWTVGTDPWL